MTFLCLETSLPMQRSHDTLASSISAENWCLETVLPLPFLCIASLVLLKPQRALRCGYTPPKRWSRHVEITCGLHHMRLRHLRYPLGHIHARIDDQLWQVLCLLWFCQESESRNRKIDSRQSHTGSDIANHLNIDQLWWVPHCLSVLSGILHQKTPGESSSKAILDPTVPTHIGRCTM